MRNAPAPVQIRWRIGSPPGHKRGGCTLTRCCAITNADTGRFFSRFAGLHRLRFRLFGFEKSQRQLLAGIRQAGFADAALLEIGCGVGYLHRALLEAGAARVTGVDLSPKMLDEARKLAAASGLAARTDYRDGDFVHLAEALAPAEVTILDKVVCCYPEPLNLLGRSLAKTQRVYALTFPRDRALTRLGFALFVGLLRALGSDFRPFVHDPASIERTITERGFARSYDQRTAGWHTQVYIRRGNRSASPLQKGIHSPFQPARG